jgi:hypothetical protein
MRGEDRAWCCTWIAARICLVSLFLYSACVEEAALPELFGGAGGGLILDDAVPVGAKRSAQVPVTGEQGGGGEYSYSTWLLRLAGFRVITSKHLLAHISLGLFSFFSSFSLMPFPLDNSIV